jgi:hypothetical protein
MALPGCRVGKDSSWARISGEALNSTQSSPFALIAMEDWVRGVALMDLERTPWQLWQLQFH